MKTRFLLLSAVLLLLFAHSSAFAQDPKTGFPPFGSFNRSGPDGINLQNLNTNFSIPVVGSPGRGINLRLPIVYDSLLWTQVTSGGTTSWTPVTDPSGKPTWGWKKDIPGGSISYKSLTTTIKCFPPDGSPWYWTTKTSYSNYVYRDILGTPHDFNVDPIDDGNCSGNILGTVTGSATDASGYYLDATTPTSPVVTSPGGIKSPSGAVTDTNGNEITKTVVNSSETDWKDTVGRTALKIIYGASSVQYQFLDPTGAYQTTTMNLGTFSIKTNFACSGVVEYTGTASLPTSIVLPNNQQYSFTYEATPGSPGYVTGRVQR